MPWPKREGRALAPGRPDDRPAAALLTVRLKYRDREVELDAEIGARFVRYEITLSKLLKALQADPASRQLALATRNIVDEANRVRFGP